MFVAWGRRPLYHDPRGEKAISGQSYRDAGVDIDAGEALVERIRPLADATRRPGVVASIGGFGARFDPGSAGFRDPVLVATTDGVGTKLKVAIAMGRHDTVGIDLVAMCVNDLVVEGAEPLFFLDYFATARLSVEAGRDIVAGIAEGCRLAGCALIGGETAEMPGMYTGDDYDLAGFAVGAFERDQGLKPESAEAGDVVLGLASSGIHSNGFSLVRKVVEDQRLDYRAEAPFAAGRALGDALLEPTRIYVKSCLAAVRAGGVRALAHITGGGLVGNVPRSLPPGLAAEIDAGSWPFPAVFRWLARTGEVTAGEMARTFNCGIGMVAIVDGEREAELTALLAAMGEHVFRIGRLVRRDAGAAGVILRGTEEAWRS